MSDDVTEAFRWARERQATADRIAASTLAAASKPFSPARMYYEAVAVVVARLGSEHPDEVRRAAAEQLRHRWKDCGAEQRARVVEAEAELAAAE